MKKSLTLCIIHQQSKVLLGMKKRGFGAGRWNGFGGKLKDGETIEDAVRRELKEEAGISANKIEKKGIIEFSWDLKPEILEVHIFRVTDFVGNPAESEEMRPRWFDINEIPYGEMWPDDKYWLPLFLDGKKFKGKFVFDDADKILRQELIEVDEI